MLIKKIILVKENDYIKVMLMDNYLLLFPLFSLCYIFPYITYIY